MQLRLHRTEKATSSSRPPLCRGVCVEAAGARLHGVLEVPAEARGLVLFASDRDLGRMDSRQVNLARELNRHGLGTLLFDLVEATDRAGSDVDLLTERLLGATDWSAEQWGLERLAVGYVGSGLGAAAAISAAAMRGGGIAAVASYSGRPDLAIVDSGRVLAPTLLVVDKSDPSLVAANVTAAAQLRCPHQLRKVHGSAHQTGVLAATPAICRWMEWHLGSPQVPYRPPLALS